MFKTTIAGASLGILLISPAYAQEMKAQDFVTQAASGGMYEVQSSQLVLEEGEAPAEVSEFAQRMVQDHTQANQQLTTLAQQQDLEVPAELRPEHQQMIDELTGAENQAETYVQQQVTAHEQTIELFQQFAEQGDSPELQQFAEQKLPTLQEHLQMAQSLPGAQ